jgi:acyl-CoA synthetase (AMP-forming)/AMP-acid ligase II
MSRESGNITEEILAGGRAAAPALCYGRETLTHGELRARVNGWTAWLLERGFRRGDRVGLFSENSPFFVAAYLAIIRAGLCVVPLQVDCSDKTLRQVVASTGMRLILVSTRFFARLQRLSESLGVSLVAESSAPSAVADGPAAIRPSDPGRELASLMLTSGSTGEPKGVMVSHRNIACNTHDIIESLGITAADRVMVVLPFCYCYGLSLLHTHLMAGGSLVLNNRFMFPEKVLDEMAAQQCTGLAGVPSTYQILLRQTRLAQCRFPALRWLQQAGGGLSHGVLGELRAALPDVRLFVMYGQTEATARLSCLAPERLDDKLGSIGKGLPHARLEVLRPDGTPVTPGSGETGEIVASGESIALGYWDDPEESDRVFRHGRLYTGDLAQVDGDGFIYVEGRARDFIKSMGNRVSPKEIEDVIAELPQVVEAAVVGFPHEIWGEALRAFVVPAVPGQLTAQEVRDHCLTQLPNYKVPTAVEFLDRLPKTSSGKVDKASLSQPCQAQPDRRDWQESIHEEHEGH